MHKGKDFTLGPLLDITALLETPRVVLMDLELTCWEDSLRTGWADPLRPPEVLEIGLALYDVETQDVISTFSSLIRPTINPTLSEYCRSLLTITQQDVDLAKPLAAVAEDIATWERRFAVADAPTCTWCTLDREWLHDDARRSNCVDPFDGRRHVNLSSLLMKALGEDTGKTPPRDAMTARLGLPPIPDRHRALPDAVDLARFCALLSTPHGLRRP